MLSDDIVSIAEMKAGKKRASCGDFIELQSGNQGSRAVEKKTEQLLCWCLGNDHLYNLFPLGWQSAVSLRATKVGSMFFVSSLFRLRDWIAAYTAQQLTKHCQRNRQPS